MTEIWKDIKGYEGLYQVSNLGRVKSLKFDRELILKYRIVENYNAVVLYANSKPKPWRVHRLVALMFIGNPNRAQQVNHKDFNRSNNCVENLEWCTAEENNNHTIRAGRHTK